MKLDLKDLRASMNAAVEKELTHIQILPEAVLALIDRIEELESGVYTAISDITWAADRHDVPANIMDCLGDLQILLKKNETEKAEG